MGDDVLYINGRLEGDLSVPRSIEVGGDKTYVYEQLTPATEWRIVHPLNKFPSVSIVDSGGSVVIGAVQYISENQVVIVFSKKFSGKAYLN